MLKHMLSAILSSVYVSIIAILSCVQFHRSQTPLRLASAVMAVMGLTIAAMSVVYIAGSVSIQAFWVYQLVVECVALTWVLSTIIQLGYAFYPLTRHQKLIWRTALGSIIIYDLVAAAELIYYCYGVWDLHALTTPMLWIYWVRQVIKVLACVVTVAYLFVPLVRHHNSNSVANANIADSNTLAVGTWYLASLGATFLAYTIMLIFYMTQGADVFTQHAQALDLCIRLTPCPIFSLPPPPFLIKYFESKCGRPARDNNPSTIIEEGITSDPRPRRPPMLVSYPTSFTSRRGSGYPFDHHSDHGERRSLGTYSPYASYDREDGDQFKLFIEGETYIGTNSTLGTTAAEASPKMKALSMASTSTQKDIDSSTVGAGKADNTVPKSLSIPTLPPLESSPMSSSPTKPTQHAHTPVLIFAAGYTPDRDEDEEAAEAARKISRRLTMEGRKDELDIFNISSMMKWPYRPSSTMPALRSSSTTINSTTTSGSKHPRPPLPALLTGSSLFRPNRNSTNENHDRDPSVPASGLEKKFHNVINGDNFPRTANNNDLTLTESHTKAQLSNEYQSHSKASTLDAGSDDSEDQTKHPHADPETVEHDTHVDIKSKHPSLLRPKSYDHYNNGHITGSLERKGSSRSNRHLRSPLGDKLSMDNIRRFSRDTITRLQEGGLGAALSLPVATGPISPTVLCSASVSANGADSGSGTTRKTTSWDNEDVVETSSSDHASSLSQRPSLSPHSQTHGINV